VPSCRFTAITENFIVCACGYCASGAVVAIPAGVSTELVPDWQGKRQLTREQLGQLSMFAAAPQHGMTAHTRQVSFMGYLRLRQRRR
jgi:hypothetical protein